MEMPRKKRECPKCGKEFSPNNKNQVNCSKECLNASGAEELTDAQREIIDRNIGLAFWLAGHYCDSAKIQLNCVDIGSIKAMLEEAAMDGLIAASRTHDPSKSKFQTWATHCIVGSLRHAVRGEGRYRSRFVGSLYVVGEKASNINVERVVMVNESVREINHLMDSGQREAALLMVKGYTLTEAAAEMNIPMWKLSRSMGAARDTLQDHGFGVGRGRR